MEGALRCYHACPGDVEAAESHEWDRGAEQISVPAIRVGAPKQATDPVLTALLQAQQQQTEATLRMARIQEREYTDTVKRA